MSQAPLLKKIEKVIAPTAESMGYEIVRLMMVGIGSGKPTLQIMAEKADGTMDVEDCSRLSQAVSALMDVEDVLQDAYYLEVSSPGIDRPLTRAKDFDRYKGFEARIEIDEMIDNQKKFKGLLKGISASNDITLETDTGDVVLPFSIVQKAKLLLTDALIEAHQQNEAAAAEKQPKHPNKKANPKNKKTKK